MWRKNNRLTLAHEVWDSCNKKEESAADESARKSVLNFIPVVERPGKTSKKSLSEENAYL